MVEQPVVVGVDGSEESERALRWAAEFARMSQAPLHAIIAWHIPTSYGMPAIYDDVDLEAQAETTLAEAVLATLGESADVTRRVEQGHPCV
jgi:nucleotide-binding universal stress UspA family protein